MIAVDALQIQNFQISLSAPVKYGEKAALCLWSGGCEPRRRPAWLFLFPPPWLRLWQRLQPLELTLLGCRHGSWNCEGSEDMWRFHPDCINRQPCWQSDRDTFGSGSFQVSAGGAGAALTAQEPAWPWWRVLNNSHCFTNPSFPSRL